MMRFAFFIISVSIGSSVAQVATLSNTLQPSLWSVTPVKSVGQLVTKTLEQLKSPITNMCNHPDYNPGPFINNSTLFNVKYTIFYY